MVVYVPENPDGLVLQDPEHLESLVLEYCDPTGFHLNLHRHWHLHLLLLHWGYNTMQPLPPNSDDCWCRSGCLPFGNWIAVMDVFASVPPVLPRGLWEVLSENLYSSICVVNPVHSSWMIWKVLTMALTCFARLFFLGNSSVLVSCIPSLFYSNCWAFFQTSKLSLSLDNEILAASSPKHVLFCLFAVLATCAWCLEHCCPASVSMVMTSVCRWSILILSSVNIALCPHIWTPTPAK